MGSPLGLPLANVFMRPSNRNSLAMASCLICTGDTLMILSHECLILPQISQIGTKAYYSDVKRLMVKFQ